MLRPGHLIQLAAVALLGLGVVMVRSAGMNFEEGRIATGVIDRPMMYAVIAVAAMLLLSHLDVQAVLLRRREGWRTWVNPLNALLAAALLLQAATLVPGVARTVNGASRWLEVNAGGVRVSFQPSELVKWAVVLFLAGWCGPRAEAAMKGFTRGMLPPMAVLAIGCGAVMIEDLGTAALIAAVGVAMLAAGGASWWKLALPMPLAAGAMYAAVASSGYRRARLAAFLDPWADPAGAGYHPIQSMLAFAQGGIGGVGLGNSVQKYYLPEDTTDFIFPILAEELGLAGAALAVLLYLSLLWAGLGILRATHDVAGRLLVLGVVLMVSTQAVINLAVVTVVAPTKGIALPLISAGGTGWIVTAAMLGLVAAVDRANAISERPDHRIARMNRMKP